MFGRIVGYIAPILIAKWLAKDEEQKRERMAKEMTKERKGVNPLLAIGALVLGTVLGGVLGFLYSPKTPDKPNEG